MIRPLEYEDLPRASDVLWKSFYEAEKKNHSIAGMEHFRDLVSPVSLSVNTLDDKVLLFGYLREGELLGVGALKDRKHVLLLYVLPSAQKSGIGKALLEYMERMCEAEVITLNSSDGGIRFYEKMGYVVTAPRRVEEGLIFTPMRKRRT